MSRVSETNDATPRHHDTAEQAESEPTEYYPQNRDDVHMVACMLQRKVVQHVPHVIAQIIDAAEYWTVTKVERRESHHNRVAVRAFSGAVASLKEPFLETSPVQGVGSMPVRKVIFRVTGRSQEWCTNPEAGLWSWYDAAKRSPASDGMAELVHGPTVARNALFQKRYQVKRRFRLAS